MTITAPRSPRLSHLVAILLITAFSLPILLFHLGTHEPTNTMELFNLVPVREAFRDGHWLMPTLNGMPRFEKPPLCVWLPAGLATLLGNDSLWIVRMPSIIVAILAALATYALGCAVFKNRDDRPGSERNYALFAALFVPALWAFDRHARMASYDIYAAGFAVCSAAFLVMLAENSLDDANQPRKIHPAQWLLLTFAAGVSLGCSLLAKGPAPAATILVPLFIWIAVFHRRKSVVAGALLAVLVSLAVTIPWLLAILARYPEAWPQWKAEVFKLSTSRLAKRPQIVLNSKRPWYYYFQIFLWVAPFTPLFIAGLCLPFLRSRSRSSPGASPREQRGRWLAWIVVIGGLVLLSFPSVKEQRYAIQILPFAVLLCVAVGQEFLRLRPQDKPDPLAALVLIGQSLFFILPAIGGLVAATWVTLNGPVPKWNGAADVVSTIRALNPFVVASVAAVMLAGSLLLWHWQARRQFARSAIALILCAWLFALIVQWAAHAEPANYTNNWCPGIDRAIALVDNSPVVTFTSDDMRPWLSTLYYFNRRIPQLSPQQIADLAAKNPHHDFLVLAIVSGYGKPVPGAAEELDAVAALTHRHPKILHTFPDENRQTLVVRFPPE